MAREKLVGRMFAGRGRIVHVNAIEASQSFTQTEQQHTQPEEIDDSQETVQTASSDMEDIGG